MSGREALRFAVRGLGANRMRSALTTLGILIGVAAVIILLAVGTGSSTAVKKSISKLGTNVLTVNRSANGNGRAGGGGGLAAARGAPAGGASTGTRIRSTALTVEDALALTDPDQLPDVHIVSPVVQAQTVTASYQGVTHTVGQFVGTAATYFGISNDTLSAGGYFTDDAYSSHAKVAVLGHTVATNLFGGDGSAAVGQTVQFNSKDFLITGVLTAKGSTGFTDSDDLVVAPLTTVQDQLTGAGGSLNSISVQANSDKVMDAAQAEIENVLDSRHQVTSTTRDYSVFNQASVLSTATSTNKTFTVLLGAVAAISLLVGGIGVMNIMLVTVTERTREIGIRKAIGAGRADIVAQFLAESVLLSFLGGLAGVIVGLVGSRFTIVGVKPVVLGWTVALAFAVAVAVGLFFGIYPANRAARLRPIDALRYE
jgi:putative ABC transport system permease protein